MTENKKGNIRYIKKDFQMGFKEKIYLPAIIAGLTLTFKTMFKKTFVIQYPEERWTPHPRFRGIHMLKKDEQGREKCVACYMCATICPANCITITAGIPPWPDRPDREKYPVEFNIDLSRCIDCGFCIEACPKDAICMTRKMWGCSYTRILLNKEKLLKNGEYEQSTWQNE